jgi:hypothetical protein
MSLKRVFLTFVFFNTLLYSYKITISLKKYQKRVNTQYLKYKNISTLWTKPYNLNAKDVKIAIFDGGRVFTNHIELKNQKIIQEKNLKLSQHATSIAGIFLAKGINKMARGIAKEATIYNFSYQKYNFSKAIKKAIDENITISNHAYSKDIQMPFYTKENQMIDRLIYKNPTHIAVFASGNVKPTKNIVLKNISNDCASKNVLTIGALDEKEEKILKLSAKGPTFDYRIKPDFAFRGLYVLTLDISSKNSYYLRRGSSYSSSFVCASIALISEAYKRKFHKNINFATLKSILIINAKDVAFDDVDIVSGFGRINPKKSVDFIFDKNFIKKSKILTIKKNETIKIEFKLKKTQNVKIATCWLDPPAKVGAKSSLVNDIDTLLTDKFKKKYFPYSVDKKTLKVVKSKQNHYDNCEYIKYHLKKGAYTFTIQANNIKSPLQQISISSNISIF